MDDVARSYFLLLLPDCYHPLARLHDKKLLVLRMVMELGDLALRIKYEILHLDGVAVGPLVINTRSLLD